MTRPKTASMRTVDDGSENRFGALGEAIFPRFFSGISLDDDAVPVGIRQEFLGRKTKTATVKKKAAEIPRSDGIEFRTLKCFQQDVQ